MYVGMSGLLALESFQQAFTYPCSQRSLRKAGAPNLGSSGPMIEAGAPSTGVLHPHGDASMRTPKRERSRPKTRACAREGDDPISFIRPAPKECTPRRRHPPGVHTLVCALSRDARFREIAAPLTLAYKTPRVPAAAPIYSRHRP